MTATAAIEQPPGAARETTGIIRSLRREDIPALVALRQRVFHHSERRTPAELAAYVDRLFFGSPASGASARDSFVYADAAGRLAGFLGVFTRRMHFGNRTIRAAIGTQLMVAPETQGLVGRRLTRALMDLPHELVISDSANDNARRVWEAAGGLVATSYSFSWSLALRPLRHASLSATTGLATRAFFYCARPAIGMGDALLSMRAKSRPRPDPGECAVPLDPRRDLSAMHGMMQQWALHPAYTPDQLEWTLGEIEAKAGIGDLHGCLVQDARRRPLGWYFYAGAAGGTGTVIQLGARKHAFGRVLAHLAADAHRRGLSGITGRLDPRSAPELSALGARLAHEGPWVLIRARGPEVRTAIEGGEAFLSRLDGEWWLAF